MVARGVLVVVLVASSVLPGRDAWAKCGAPARVIEPESGAKLPPRAVLYVFSPLAAWGEGDPARPQLRVDDGRRPLRHTLELVSRTPSFVVHRLRIEDDTPTHLRVSWRAWWGEVVAAYEIDRHAIAPAAARTSIAEVRYRRSAWTCSHEDALVVIPSLDAPAYRVEWASSAAAFWAGRRERTIFPRSHAAFWAWSQPTRPVAGPTPLGFGLGYLNCFGETFPQGVYHVAVTALLADGREVPALGPIRMAAYLPLLDSLAGYVADLAPVVWFTEEP